MTDWLSQYSTALDERDAREKAHKPYIDAYTKLADRTVKLEAREAAHQSQPQPAALPPPVARTESSRGKGREAISPPPAEQPPTDILARLRNDLSATQKARSALQSQVDDLTTTLQTVQQQSKTSTNQINNLTQQKNALERRLRDRDEELRGKTKLAEDAQDEMVAMGLQLNVAEEKSQRLTRENKELVERWMKRMGEEAERPCLFTEDDKRRRGKPPVAIRDGLRRDGAATTG
ncbi:autophagy protein 16, interacts with Atg12p-Atg5p [Vermiconidia calcicola]|uniref:Autophagy protein 16, interacts with Atg12p-Atg5p n=1 Tax=Vermiconidia calcicola TaxID=1690605 RepID=A0ACC3NQT3_9PEZI|nr:autophagy protein 16, interacts with Atg12p-Atg5p [Vermiconidia calcicola]